MSTSEKIIELEAAKKKIRTQVEEDGYNKARLMLRGICAKRGGKFKLSEKQFVEAIVDMWVAAELTAYERVLRCLEMDPDIKTKEDCAADIHIAIQDISPILKSRGLFDANITINDLVPGGRFATDSSAYQNKVEQ